MHEFTHPALSLNGERSLVYTAFSKHYFYYRMFISKYVIEQGNVPLNPFMLFDYFLCDAVDRNFVRDANNSLVKRADSIWVFGPVSNGVLAEIQMGQKMNKEISYFRIDKPHQILKISKDEVEMEKDVQELRMQLV